MLLRARGPQATIITRLSACSQDQPSIPMGRHTQVLMALALVLVAGAVSAAISEEEAVAAGCSRAFTRELRYVCASDGAIHHNPSIFEYHQCVGRLEGRELTQMPMAHCDPAFDDTQDL
jgi:hypothetical protein